MKLYSDPAGPTPLADQAMREMRKDAVPFLVCSSVAAVLFYAVFHPALVARPGRRGFASVACAVLGTLFALLSVSAFYERASEVRKGLREDRERNSRNLAKEVMDS